MCAHRLMTTVMCDDVRREAGNKISYLGIYAGSLLLPSFPIALPKLCFVMSLICDGDQPRPHSLVFRVLNDDQLMNEIVIPSAALDAPLPENSEGPQSRRLVYSAVMQMFPVQFQGPCTLRARAMCDDVEIKGGKWVVQASREAAEA